MKSCPTCGAYLTDRMVADIANPMRQESCPKAKRKASNVRQPVENEVMKGDSHATRLSRNNETG